MSYRDPPDLCSQKTPGILSFLRSVDCFVAGFAGNRNGETISAVAAREISKATGLSRQASMDAFHVTAVGSAAALAAVKVKAKPEVVLRDRFKTMPELRLGMDDVAFVA